MTPPNFGIPREIRESDGRIVENPAWIEACLAWAAMQPPCIQWADPPQSPKPCIQYLSRVNGGLHVEPKTHSGHDGELSFDDAVRTYEEWADN